MSVAHRIDSPNGTNDRTIMSLRDRLREKNGMDLDPLAALRPPAERPTLVAEAVRVIPNVRPEFSPDGDRDGVEEEAIEASDDFTNDLNLSFDDITWLSAPSRTVTAKLLITLPLKMDVVRMSKWLVADFGENPHVRVGFVRDDQVVFFRVADPSNDPSAMFVRRQGEVGGRSVIDEFTMRGWTQGRYEVQRAGPNVWTCKKSKRVGDASPGNSGIRKTKTANVIKVASPTSKPS